ncbi:hypothetical protein A2645_00615 [Candidatus Nomurabacteria bacterium RIFCSPHIGHO2_01_FULL_39_9]|uniref:Lipopolysaccharide assembly protein A domain-containing protein n=1 Tax=Candidatus Nomurabacteria bacterium RIFCSPHIGHO2_01_FULL_39_9 TaxID=1801735 RepID=A0A1F6UWP4_9BACT|nr:MAG: hypothetical protein A2645_00615 [Candidatus Nomurabacteria bacterium RIFCSPHIGHO2_01_FULL_39_9]
MKIVAITCMVSSLCLTLLFCYVLVRTPIPMVDIKIIIAGVLAAVILIFSIIGAGIIAAILSQKEEL